MSRGEVNPLARGAASRQTRCAANRKPRAAVDFRRAGLSRSSVAGASQPGRLKSTSDLLQRRFVAMIDLTPVHHIPKRGDVVGPAILVFQIVGVFPNVETQHRHVAMHDRAVLVGGAFDQELFVFIEAEPGPTAAKTAHARLLQRFFEGVEAAQFGFDGVGQLADRSPSFALAEIVQNSEWLA